LIDVDDDDINGGIRIIGQSREPKIINKNQFFFFFVVLDKKKPFEGELGIFDCGK
jgi:hypothetical protein